MHLTIPLLLLPNLQLHLSIRCIPCSLAVITLRLHNRYLTTKRVVVVDVVQTDEYKD